MLRIVLGHFNRRCQRRRVFCADVSKLPCSMWQGVEPSSRADASSYSTRFGVRSPPLRLQPTAESFSCCVANEPCRSRQYAKIRKPQRHR